MSYSFSAPRASSSGDELPLAQINGHYVLVAPIKFEPSVPTKYGATDAITVNVVDLSTGTHHLGVKWWGAIARSLDLGAGALVLGQVAQVTTSSGNPAWTLQAAVENAEVVAAANKWLEANPGVLDGRPAVAAPAPTTSGLAGNLI